MTEREKVDKGAYESYFEYNRILRTWFVAFGVGGPALFLMYEKIALRLKEANLLKDVVEYFFVGVALQILGAFLNKIANWYLHMSTVNKDFDKTIRFKIGNWYVDQIWPDMIFDIGTMVVFGYATWFLISVFL
jgi:hypothetical protein